MKAKRHKAEMVYLLLFLALGGLLFYMSAITKATVPEPLTASVYGMIISGLFILTALSRFVALIVNKGGNAEEELKIHHPQMILISAVAMIIYTVGILKIGYYVVTFIYTTGMVMLLREKGHRTVKNWLLTAVGCLVFTFVLYWIFSAFNVFLPNAWLI